LMHDIADPGDGLLAKERALSEIEEHIDAMCSPRTCLTVALIILEILLFVLKSSPYLSSASVDP
jgi:hypothetical protein